MENLTGTPLGDLLIGNAEANARLGSVETRLGKLDGQIAELRAQAERDSALDEQRIKASVEEEKQKLLLAAEQEVAAATAQAHRQLQKYAAELAIEQAGRKLAILSNELDLFYGADFRHKLQLLDRFDVVIDATHTGILKPDPRAYRAVTDALGLDPQACVFVDDQERNIEGAIACGLTTVWFDVQQPLKSYQQAVQLLGLALD